MLLIRETNREFSSYSKMEKVEYVFDHDVMLLRLRTFLSECEYCTTGSPLQYSSTPVPVVSEYYR
jgi:hypothetical protein